MMSDTDNKWFIFQGNNVKPHGDDMEKRLPPPPSWRPYGASVSPGVSRRKRRGQTFQTRPNEVKMVNAALYLRRPLLITGRPGTGKSSLAYAIAEELELGEVLYWPITTRTTLKNGLYNYDAIGRLQEVKQLEAKGKASEGDTSKSAASASVNTKSEAQQVADFIALGPLGTALLKSSRPRVLLIDEIDKSDIDLPNDLLTIFEEGRFEIPELLRLEKEDPDGTQDAEPTEVRVRTAYSDMEDQIAKRDRKATIEGGRVVCNEFPLVILTSNGERDFPPPFLRRCLRLNMYEPDREQLVDIVNKHFERFDKNGEKHIDISKTQIEYWISAFLDKRDNKKEQLATDQLLNALFMVAREKGPVGDSLDKFIKDYVLASLDRPLPADMPAGKTAVAKSKQS
jgi:MoxR-like ATPase